MIHMANKPIELTDEQLTEMRHNSPFPIQVRYLSGREETAMLMGMYASCGLAGITVKHNTPAEKSVGHMSYELAWEFYTGARKTLRLG